MLAAVEDYLSEQQFNKEEKDDLRKEVFDYCNDCITTGEDAHISELSDTLSKSSDTQFKDFYQDQSPYQLKIFLPHQNFL